MIKKITTILKKTPIGNSLMLFHYLETSKAMLGELKKLPIVDSGEQSVDGKKTPFITLEDGTIFFGRFPNDLERAVFHRWKGLIKPAINEESIRVSMDVILRYLYPHAMPYIAPPYSRSQRKCFHPQHIETIWDLPDWTEEKKKALAGKFSVNENEVYMDVGAYIGFGVIRMSKAVGAGGTVVAVEADPDSFWLLKQNVEANNLSNVILIPKAVSNHSGVSAFFKTQRQANSLLPGMVVSQNSIEVETSTIDDILSSRGIKTLDRISVTINGVEVEAVEGMKSTLASSKDLKMSIAGWYKRDNQRVGDIIAPTLQSNGMKLAIGRMGGLLAWK